MEFSHYKAFLFDVDKTLTNSNKEISSVTQHALQQLSQKGYLLGVCTGRHFLTIRERLKKYFPSDSLHIVAGGAVVIRSDGIIHSQTNLPADIVRALAEISKKHDARFLLQSMNGMYGDEKTLREKSEYVLSDSERIPIHPVNELVDWSVPLVVMSDISDACIEEIQLLPVSTKPMRDYSGKKYADITANGITKAAGIHQWCTVTGIQPDEIIGFGDSENDIEFLKTVGYSVAMGNAIDVVQSIADEVTDDCDHDGVASWIAKNIV